MLDDAITKEMAVKAQRVDEMTLREAVAELARIRNEYEDGRISLATANEVGKPFVKKYNTEAKARALKYGLKAKTGIPYNVKWYPNFSL